MCFSNLQMFNAGMVAGVFTTGIMTPGERIKCLLQVCMAYYPAHTRMRLYEGVHQVKIAPVIGAPLSLRINTKNWIKTLK